MMHIDIDELELTIDPTWKLDADAAKLAVLHPAGQLTRSQVINAHQKVWKNLKEKLKALSYNKCWYCETINPRSDNAVDHYRPKGNVKDAAPPHEGYWWLAFEWRNYRFCCTYCNSARTSATTSGGKQDNFPLRDENKRARSDTDDLDLEGPILLDPILTRHIGLIAFADDGTVGPAFDSKTDGLKCKMAEVSIKIYHLNQDVLKDLRAARLWQVRKWVDEADKYLARSIRNEDPVAEKTADERIQNITAAISRKAEYSTAVKHLLAGMVNSDAAQMVWKNH